MNILVVLVNYSSIGFFILRLNHLKNIKYVLEDQIRSCLFSFKDMLKWYSVLTQIGLKNSLVEDCKISNYL